MSEQSEAYSRRELLRQLESLRSTESAKAAEWLESLKSYPGYQALTQDPEWVRITAEWKAAIQQDERDRAIFKGRSWEDLSEAEKTRCEELSAALHERLFPLTQAIVKLRGDYGIPSAPAGNDAPTASVRLLTKGNPDIIPWALSPAELPEEVVSLLDWLDKNGGYAGCGWDVAVKDMPRKFDEALAFAARNDLARRRRNPLRTWPESFGKTLWPSA